MFSKQQTGVFVLVGVLSRSCVSSFLFGKVVSCNFYFCLNYPIICCSRNIKWTYAPKAHYSFARKMFCNVFCLALLLPCVFAQVATPDLSNVTTAFSSAQIVPDVLQSFNPVDAVNVTFTDPVTMESIDVVPGILLTMERKWRA